MKLNTLQNPWELSKVFTLLFGAIAVGTLSNGICHLYWDNADGVFSWTATLSGSLVVVVAGIRLASYLTRRFEGRTALLANAKYVVQELNYWFLYDGLEQSGRNIDNSSGGSSGGGGNSNNGQWSVDTDWTSFFERQNGGGFHAVVSNTLRCTAEYLLCEHLAMLARIKCSASQIKRDIVQSAINVADKMGGTLPHVTAQALAIAGCNDGGGFSRGGGFSSI